MFVCVTHSVRLCLNPVCSKLNITVQLVSHIRSLKHLSCCYGDLQFMYTSRSDLMIVKQTNERAVWFVVYLGM